MGLAVSASAWQKSLTISQKYGKICLILFSLSAILAEERAVLSFSGSGRMLAEQRRDFLLELVRVRRFASLPDLAEQLAVSESTVRRDLANLEQQGAARRIHGGGLYTGSSPKLPHFDAQQPIEWAKKRAIAAAAVKLIEDGDSILVDGGSTTYEVARLLVGRPLHVVTTSLPVGNLFASDSNSDLVLIGGNICPRSGVARGPYADQMLAKVRVRKTILSVAGIHDEGFFNDDMLLVETERAMMRAADEVIVVADSTKFGRQSLTHLCPLEAVSHLVVDSGISPEWRDRILAAGVDLIVAGNDETEST
jgi:DeoR family transcriptional regulator, fructose operon transcriptional repressor